MKRNAEGHAGYYIGRDKGVRRLLESMDEMGCSMLTGSVRSAIREAFLAGMARQMFDQMRAAEKEPLRLPSEWWQETKAKR